MRKSVAAMSLSATLLGGSALGATVFAPHLVGAAQTTDETPTTAAPTTEAEAGATPTTPATPTERPSRAEHLTEALQPLVDDGTITAAQRDAVIAALDAAKPDGPGFGEGHHVRFGIGLEAAATAIGIDEDTLRTELQAGSTLAEVATNHGVEAQTVIDALVADATARLDQAVTDGKLTQEQADARKAELTERITEAVNNEGFPRGPGRPGRGPGFGPGLGLGLGLG